MQKFSFHSNGSQLAAILHLDRDAGQARRPGIIVIGSWLTVKEQMAANYAPRVAAAGLAALTFDFRGYGASEGAPREVESARSKCEDILNAAAFLRTRPEVDPERIGVLAICASASYTALALQSVSPDRSLIQSVAMVAPWIHDAELAAQLYGGKEAVSDRLAQAQKARQLYAATGKVEYVAAVSNQDASAAMYAPGDVFDYYLNPKRGAVPAWGGRFATMGWTEWLETDFVALAPGFSIPLCVVTGEQTATPSGVKKFAAGLPSTPDVASSDGTQFDFYDNPERVRFASDRAIAHFRNTLA